MYSPTEGDILIDGKSLRKELDEKWVQQNISYVTQEPILFRGTILENLLYGNQGFDHSMENVQKAAQIANCHQFILQMPNGYDSIITEKGGNLSGGQK